MTIEKQDITSDFYAGNHKILVETIVQADGSPKDLTDAEVTFALFTTTGVLCFTKTSLEVTQIEITDAVGGECLIYLLPPDTVFLFGTYMYQVNVIDVTGYEETVTTGKINIFKSFARRLRRNVLHAYSLGILPS
jgi:hypothetical protein